MPAKSKSPEAAQHKVWKAERTALARTHAKVLRDANKAQRAASKKLKAAEREYDKALRRIDREVPKATANIERRIAILDGRLGA
jgi:uncharacterized protein YlxW (UPF0749 family)